MKVAVVTPSINNEYFWRCLGSVQNQTYKNLEHYIFIDGKEHKNRVEDAIFFERCDKKVNTITLEKNIGKGWYGHRVYAACSFLVDADVICYVDEDNWLEPDHVENIVKKIEEGYDWAYSLRNICDRKGNFLCQDNCESLGKYPVFHDDSQFHIDTSCFGIKKSVALQIGHAWYGQWGADRQFFSALRKYFTYFDCTNKYSLNYRLDGNPNSVTQEFFENGNKLNMVRYNNVLPWRINEKT